MNKITYTVSHKDIMHLSMMIIQAGHGCPLLLDSKNARKQLNSLATVL